MNTTLHSLVVSVRFRMLDIKETPSANFGICASNDPDVIAQALP